MIIVTILGIYFAYPFALEGVGRFLIVQDKLEKADVIVVLAGDPKGERVDQAVKLYEKKYAPKMLMSGGDLAWNLKAAYWMKKQANHLGVPSYAIILEDQSFSTLENAKFSLPLLKKVGAKSIILVTSPTHTRRAKRTFKKVLAKDKIKVFSYPVQKSSFKLKKWWQRHEDVQLVVWEYVSLIYYLLKGY